MLAGALALCDIAQLVYVPVFRELFTIPAVLVLPGWTFLIAIRRSSEAGEPGIMRVAISVVITFAIWPLLVLTLAALSIKITHTSVLDAFNAAILCGLSISVLTDWRLPRNDGPAAKSGAR